MCPEGTWMEEITGSQNYCVDCSDNCKTCGAHSSECTSCHEGMALDGDICVYDCPYGEYKALYPASSNEATCEDCESPCASCEYGASFCTSCEDTHAWNPDPDVLKCVALDDCPPGTVPEWASDQNGMICMDCQGFIYDGTCVEDCCERCYEVDHECFDCEYPCQECKSPYECTSCNQEFDDIATSFPRYLDDIYCVDECPSDKYTDDENKCIKCDFPCETCFGEGEHQCSSCLQPMNPEEPSLKLLDPECQGDVCETSVTRFCVSDCPVGYYEHEDGEWCYKCDFPCAECGENDPKHCLSCQ